MSTFLLLAAVLLAEPKPVQVVLLDGQTATGTLVAVDAEHVVIQTDDDKRTIDFTTVRSIIPADDKGASNSPSRYVGDSNKRPLIWLETIDGSRIPGTGYTVAKGTAELKLADGETLKLPTKSIRLVEFPVDGVPATGSGANWVADVKADLATDLIVVHKREGIDYVEGAAGDVTDEIVNFNVDGDNVPVKRAKVAGLVYFHPPDSGELPEAKCVFQDVAGWRVNAKSVSYADGDFRLVPTFGGEIARPLASLKLLDFSPGRMGYLSDLTPVSTEWTPYVDFGKENDSLAKFYRLRQDRGLDGGAIRLAGKSYTKGLAIPGRTAVSYKVSGKGKRLKALAGIDDSVREAGSARLVITGDGKTLYDGKILGRDEPVDLDLDVAGVKRLNIVVDFGEGLDVGNYLDLADARIVK
jgi:NPCBM/NEW2 domain